MSKDQQLLALEKKMQTLAVANDIKSYTVLIEIVEKLNSICEGDSLVTCLTKDFIVEHYSEFKALAQKYKIPKLKIITLAAKKGSGLVAEYLTLKKELENPQKDLPSGEIDETELSEMFSEDEEYIEEQDEDEEQSNSSKKKKSHKKGDSKKSNKKYFLIFVVVFTLIASFFIYLYISELLNEITNEKQGKNQTTVQKRTDNPAHINQDNGKRPPILPYEEVSNNPSPYSERPTTPPPTGLNTNSNTSPQSVSSMFGEKKNTSSNIDTNSRKNNTVSSDANSLQAKQAEQQQKKVSTPTERENTLPPPPPVQKKVEQKTSYPPIPMESIKKNAGGVCEVVPKYSTKDNYIYYVREGNKYIPAYQDKSWDGKGIIINKRTVGLSIDEKNGLVEVDDGKYLPIELFSSCTTFKE